MASSRQGSGQPSPDRNDAMTSHEVGSIAALDDRRPVSVEPRATTPPGWPPRGTRLGIYLHLPFCGVRCGYCSFNTAPYTPRAMERLLAALGDEIALVAGSPWSRSIRVRSVFVGGGTP